MPESIIPVNPYNGSVSRGRRNILTVVLTKASYQDIGRRILNIRKGLDEIGGDFLACYTAQSPEDTVQSCANRYYDQYVAAGNPPQEWTPFTSTPVHEMNFVLANIPEGADFDIPIF